ncbi:hypothetical protein [Acrocarpospora sp. B8E8]
MMFRSLRLQALLGTPVDQATRQDFAALIGLEAAWEAEDLHYSAL